MSLPVQPVTGKALEAAATGPTMEAWMEGATRLAAAPSSPSRGIGAPGARVKDQPFYNPGMVVNRDLSVLIVEAEAKRKGREIDVADALAGTGARSVRLAREVQAPIVVHANDAMPVAVKAIRATAKINEVPVIDAPPVPGTRPNHLLVSASDAHAFLARRRYDVVDVDPCGSPMPFLDAAIRATRTDGLVCVTATDTGALAGTFPRVCRRRYDAHHGLHGEPWRAEVGLRILAGAIVRGAARHERSASVMLSVAKGHWMRVVCRLDEGRQSTDAGLKHLGYAHVAGGHGTFRSTAPESGAWAGPLWTGSLHDAAFVGGMQDAAGGKALTDATRSLLGLLEGEVGAAPFWIVPDRLHALGQPPRRDVLIERLHAHGSDAARTHMDPQGVRTSADTSVLAGLWA